MIGAAVLPRMALALRLLAWPAGRIAPPPAIAFPAPAPPTAIEDDLGELRYLITSRGVQPVRLGRGERERHGYREVRAYNIADDGRPVLVPRWRRVESLHPTVDAARVAYVRVYERSCTHFRGTTRRAVQTSLLDLAPGSGPRRRPLAQGAIALGLAYALTWGLDLLEWSMHP
ncbi:hypothetical protein [Roseococcus pinisoli]|uniref:Uncharacterized protein n=1 Tax=Roseococcus pinisoli TaxID=2835040 RepID=A0ABS5Q9X7_9PROT|nr:hypothetical protein [Roseococcus pinisoli]MBS7810509.1 hypothetical protein [Roseococcus pinisoli]